MYVSDGELKEFIIDSGLVAKKDVDAALAAVEDSDQSLGDLLVSRGALSEDALRHVHSYVLGIPFVDLKGQRIPIEVLSLIPEPIARTHNIIAFKKEGDSLEVAVLDVDDLVSIDTVQKKTGFKILPRLTDTGSIKHALLHYQKLLKEMFGDIISAEAGKLRELVAGKASSNEELKKMAEELPVVRMVDSLLRHAIVQGASDIHIEPRESEMLVRYRIDGILHDAMTLPKTAIAGITARIKVLSTLKLNEQRLPQDGRFVMETGNDRISFRVSTLPTSFGEKIVLRLLRETGEGFTLEVLGFQGENLERVHQALRHRSGLILVTGPKDSGKTTLLYTLIDILNRPDKNISTIEDPIEYQLKRINQMQVNPLFGISFVNGLRALIRQDADIIMVGDIHDGETAALAASAAASGRLILAGITADTATDAVARMKELGIDPLLLSTVLRIIIVQKLVTKPGGGRRGAPEVRSAEEALRDVISS